MNRYGKIGSPYRNSCLHLKAVSGIPLTNTEENPKLSRASIHPHHFTPKPLALRVCKRKDQRIESKALEKSSLRKNVGHLYLVHADIISWANTTLSSIERPWLKADWEGSIKLPIFDLSMLVSTLETVLRIPLIKLIGRKCPVLLAPASLGMRTI